MIESPPVGRLEGNVVVVTGAGHGLGRAYALALAAEGARVVANDLDGDAAAAVARDIESAGGQSVPHRCALSSVEDGAALIGDAVATFGAVDMVVNNAGLSRPAALADLDAAVLDHHLGVHLRATVGTTKAAFSAMTQAGRGGRVVNTVSGHALEPKAGGSAAYAAAKGAVFSFTLAAALEGRAFGIAVNAVAPLAYTAMSEQYLATVPGATDRLSPDHVARVVVELACAPVGVTGKVLRVEGEMVAEYGVALSERVPFGRISEVLGA